MRYLTWGMKAKVLSLIIVPTLVVLVMFGLFIQRDMHNLQHDFEEHGYLIANQLAIASEYGAITENIDLLEDAVRSVIDISDVDGVVILSAAQETYVEEGHVRLIEKMPLEFDKATICHRDDAFSIFCAPILYTPFEVDDFGEGASLGSHSVFIGSIQVSISSETLAQKIADLITYAVAFIFFTVIGTLLMARRIDSQIIGPIVELTGVVKGIGQGRLDRRAILKSSGEIGLLQDGVNLMATELKSYHDEMELKVTAATEGLRAALNEIKQKSGELEIAWAKAEEASQAKTLFLAAMSHEIRTPLSGMLGMLNLIEQSELNPLQLDQIRNIEDASRALKRLIDDILDFSRLEAGKLNLVNKPFSIAVMVDEVVTMLAPSAQLKGLEFVVDIERSLPERVVGDSLRIRQILINILSNAIKFTDRGSVQFHIARSDTIAAPGMAAFSFEIKDTGIGIPAERQVNVFERFSQVEQGRERHYEGSGLGATTAKQLVELMGGEILLHSELGEGSCFTINLTLPLLEPAVEPESGAGQEPLKGERVVVVESHPEAGTVLQRYLQDFGAEVTLLQNSDVLAETLQQQPYNRIVVSDEFDNEATHVQVDPLLQQQDKILFGCISSFPDMGEGATSHQYDFKWTKPITPNRLQRSLGLIHQDSTDVEDAINRPHLDLLVAEDDEINAKVITFLLEKRGHHVTRVVNGKQALSQLESNHYDGVFMDVRMPEMSGIDATSAWRADESSRGHQHIPIIALTANDSERELCLEVGMDGFIVKPINDGALAELESLIPGLNKGRHLK